jgi:hypothetical protein
MLWKAEHRTRDALDNSHMLADKHLECQLQTLE